MDNSDEEMGEEGEHFNTPSTTDKTAYGSILVTVLTEKESENDDENEIIRVSIF